MTSAARPAERRTWRKQRNTAAARARHMQRQLRVLRALTRCAPATDTAALPPRPCQAAPATGPSAACSAAHARVCVLCVCVQVASVRAGLSVRAISRLSARACFCKRPRGRPLLLLLLRLERSDLRRVLRPQCALLCRQSMRSESMRTVWRRASKQATALSVRAEACAQRGCDTSSAIRHRPLDSARAGGRAANAVLASSAALPHPAIACAGERAAP
jgi:hypothetical protein